MLHLVDGLEVVAFGAPFLGEDFKDGLELVDLLADPDDCLLVPNQIVVSLKDALLSRLLHKTGVHLELGRDPDPVVDKVEHVLHFAFLNFIRADLEANQAERRLDFLRN